MKLDYSWVSQSVGALGAAKAEGIRNQLGRPTLDRLTVLIRESAQNSWDARDATSTQPVRFCIDLVRLGAARGEIWRELFRESEAMPGVRLAAALSEPDPWVLLISDRGTVGLAGPTRGDQQREDVPRNYTSFVLNSGDTGEGLGGGTYGFGKSSLFAASRTGAILAHTRCRATHGSDESRMVGIALGRSHTMEGVNYTGRHWWGRANDGGVEPLRNVEADAWAEQLGLPGFAEDERGTTIALACPNLGDRSPEAALDWMREAILWHLWPKMLPGADGRVEMLFSASLEGESLPIPDPREHEVLRSFADALHRVEMTGDQTEMVEARSIGARAGHLSLRRSFGAIPQLSGVAVECGLRNAVHHTCLLRTPRLVVQYLGGDVPADPSVWYAGVFKADADVNRSFARSEPPTHDEWVGSQLEGDEKTLVNATMRELRRRMREFVRPALSEQPDSPFVALGAASRYFADLLGEVGGEGAGVSPTNPSGAQKPLRLIGDLRWERFEDADVLVQDVDVQPRRPVNAEPRLTIAAWGGGSVSDDGVQDDEESPNRGSAGDLEPEVIGWRSPHGAFHAVAARAFDAGDAGRWQLLVRPVAETVTSLTLATGDPS